MKVLMIDNNDSFTFNLVHYFRNAGSQIVTYRNDSGLEVVEKEKPALIVISPGPSTPQNAGMSMEVISRYAGVYPIFGVCLGMQAIAEAFGTKIGQLDEIMHGGASNIYHDSRTIFEGLPSPFLAGRYHSLGTLAEKVEGPLEVSARTANGVVMGLRHKEFKVEGVQFHPESVLTMAGNAGYRLIENVVRCMANGNS